MGTSGTTARTSTTTSMPGRPFRWRNSSRMRRFARFRRTAPPTRRVAMMPSRATSIPFGRVNSVRYRPRLRTPCCWTRWNSGRRRIRSRRVRLRRTSRVVGRSPNGDPLAALGTPALQHSLPGLRAHPLAEAVRSAATAPVRLIRTLHDPTTPTAAPARRHASTARRNVSSYRRGGTAVNRSGKPPEYRVLPFSRPPGCNLTLMDSNKALQILANNRIVWRDPMCYSRRSADHAAARGELFHTCGRFLWKSVCPCGGGVVTI